MLWLKSPTLLLNGLNYDLTYIVLYSCLNTISTRHANTNRNIYPTLQGKALAQDEPSYPAHLAGSIWLGINLKKQKKLVSNYKSNSNIRN